MVEQVVPHEDWIVGKHGLLNIHAFLHEGHTEIEYRDRRTPFQWQGYHYQDHDDEPFFPLLTTTGGFVEGDMTEFYATLDPDTRVLVVANEASKFYNCLEGNTSREIVKVTVGPRALFEYYPGMAIPYRRSRVDRNTQIFIDNSSKLFASDMLSAGRIYYGEGGEIFEFDSLKSSFEVVVNNDKYIIDRLIATDRQHIDALKNLWNGAYHMCIVIGYAPDLPSNIEDSVYENCNSIDGVEVGVSRIVNMVVVRILSCETWQAREAIFRAWEVMRPSLARKPAIPIKSGASPIGI